MASKLLFPGVGRSVAVPMLAASISLTGCGGSPTGTAAKSATATSTVATAVQPAGSAIVNVAPHVDPFAHFKQMLKTKDINMAPGTIIADIEGCSRAANKTVTCAPLTPASGVALKALNIRRDEGDDDDWDGRDEDSNRSVLATYQDGNWVLTPPANVRPNAWQRLEVTAPGYRKGRAKVRLVKNGPLTYVVIDIFTTTSRASDDIDVVQVQSLKADPATGTVTPGGSLTMTLTATLSDGTTRTGLRADVSTGGGGTTNQNADGTYTFTAGSSPGPVIITFAFDTVKFEVTVTVVQPPPIITTIAGNGSSGDSGDGGPATAAEFFGIYGVAADASGNVYIADTNDQRIRKVDTKGIITTYAGNGTAGYSGDGGPATAAQIYNPNSVAVDNSGNVYVGDTNNNVVRKIDTKGTITTIAGNGTYGYSGDGGPATAAALSLPFGVAIDGSGNVYIADFAGARIRKVTASGTITTIAGNGTSGYSGDGGPATAAQINHPVGVAVDGGGNVYFADHSNNAVREVMASDGTIKTIAGNGGSCQGPCGDGGPATAAQLFSPAGLALDGSGNLYIADSNTYRIRKIDTTGIITAYAGNGTYGFSGDGGLATAAELAYPTSVAVGGSGNIYIADTNNDRIRMVTP